MRKSAVLLLLAAKLVGTATLAWLFQLVEPALMRIPAVRALVPALEGVEGLRC